jgi:hypothetical protein
LRYAYIEIESGSQVAWWYRDEDAKHEAEVAGTRFDDREVV